MSAWRRWPALAVWAVALAAGRRATAQNIHLTFSASTGDSLSPAPVMTVSSIESQPELGPYTVQVALSLEGDFRTPFLVHAAPAENVTFTLDSLLPQQTVIYFKSTLLDRFGDAVATEVQHHPVRSWVRLVSPARGTNDVIFTRTPTFEWSSPPITFPPGLWQFDVAVFKTGDATPAFTATTNDLNLDPPFPLDACTSYTWQVSAQGSNSTGHTVVTAKSPGTFVIQSPDCPTATIFYQNFPNPFGGPTGARETCFWFDLARGARVRLAIYDIRLHHVRQIIPGTVGDGNLKAGPYGRQPDVTQTGCTPGFAWDGTDDMGRPVPPGVYKAIFDADGIHSSKTILYKGP
ncbi:MAG TPA: hypothetical protein VHB25_08355 [Gemmatimonadaceae bacterium]|nr:hypothetical protein [Gemmatimonadaceae bacterium]